MDEFGRDTSLAPAGRGRGRTLPAWATDGDGAGGGGADGESKAADGGGGSGAGGDEEWGPRTPPEVPPDWDGADPRVRPPRVAAPRRRIPPVAVRTSPPTRPS